MNTVRIGPADYLRGEVKVPGDKSISHRAVILASISDGRSRIKGFLKADDTLRTCKALGSMDILIEGTDKEELIVYGKGLEGLREPEDILDLGNSGTSIRLLAGLLSGQGFFSVLTGDESLRRRPMKRVTGPLRTMGAEIYGRGDGNYAPLAIKGRTLSPINYDSPVPSAQVKSSLLLAGLYAEGETAIKEPKKSRDHTERMLRFFGAEVNESGLTVSLKGRQTLNGREIEIPADFSSAAFFLVAGILVPDSEILLKDIGVNPTRTGLLNILKSMGAEFKLENLREVSKEPVADIVVRSVKLKGTEIKGEEFLRAIDEFPILCVAASLSEGETVIKEAEELRVKESDRIATMAQELRKMGVEVVELPDGLKIKGKDRLKGSVCSSHGDHRVAMAMIIAGLLAEGETTVEDVDCINTSFPGFMDVLQSLRENRVSVK